MSVKAKKNIKNIKAGRFVLCGYLCHNSDYSDNPHVAACIYSVLIVFLQGGGNGRTGISAACRFQSGGL